MKFVLRKSFKVNISRTLYDKKKTFVLTIVPSKGVILIISPELYMIKRKPLFSRLYHRKELF